MHLFAFHYLKLNLIVNCALNKIHSVVKKHGDVLQNMLNNGNSAES